jgi:hypothetical protein
MVRHGTRTIAGERALRHVWRLRREQSPRRDMLIRKKGQSTWCSPEVTTYKHGEDELQQLIARSPELLGAGRNVAVVRELGVPEFGSLDLATVAPSGAITLVECKLAKNPEIRRHVVGQVFAYAAGLWKLSYEEFDRRFTDAQDPERKRAGRPLIKAVHSVAGAEWDPETFRAAVADNLSAGRFDLIIAVDSITAELKRVVRYLNAHTVAEIRVLALELGYVAHADVEMLLSTVYGEEQKAPPSPGRRCDEESFFAAVAQLSPEGLSTIRHIYKHAIRQGASMNWGGGASPSVGARFDIHGTVAPVWTCYAGPSVVSVDINFEWMLNKVPMQRLLQLAASLCAISHAVAAHLPGFDKAEADWLRRPSLPVSLLLPAPALVQQFLSALDELVLSSPGETSGLAGPPS